MNYEGAKALWNAEIDKIGPLYGAAVNSGVAQHLPLGYPRETHKELNESVVRFLRKWADAIEKG